MIGNLASRLGRSALRGAYDTKEKIFHVRNVVYCFLAEAYRAERDKESASLPREIRYIKASRCSSIPKSTHLSNLRIKFDTFVDRSKHCSTFTSPGLVKIKEYNTQKISKGALWYLYKRIARTR